MHMTGIDWGILALFAALMLASALFSRRFVRGVADFLAAGRTAGRYLLSVSQGASAIGAITVVGLFEMNYVAGFPMTWWGFSMALVVLVITVSGWVVYRFRQTRALTLAQFFEMRYSRGFRIFAGTTCFLSGLVNFGIFPAVGARFFIYYCGLPQAVPLLGVLVPTFPLVMLALLGTALFFVFTGGQVAVITADFLQGVFIQAVFIAVTLFVLARVDWTQIVTALSGAPADASLLNPFRTAKVPDFNLGYFLIGVLGAFYGTMAWQGTQAYNASAASAHEAKMAQVLNNWRILPQSLMLLVLPLVAYTVLHHPDFAGAAEAVRGTLATVPNEALHGQLRTPLVLTRLLPAGLLGLFAAMMLAASITTENSYMHSWASILVQDVILPLRRRPFTPRQHLRALRLAILGVTLFIFCFSLLFQQSEAIFLFFAITGAIFAGGAGAVIIGGLYWKRGTTAAAWAAMLTGSGVAVGGIVLQQLFPGFPINGQMFWGLAMVAASGVYVLVSLLAPRPAADLERMLGRAGGREDAPGSGGPGGALQRRGLRLLGMGAEFTRGDRAIYAASCIWTFSWVALFLAGTLYNLTHTVGDAAWARFWRVYIHIHLVVSCLVLVWMSAGGARDLRRMFGRLRTQARDAADDGTVRRPAPGSDA